MPQRGSVSIFFPETIVFLPFWSNQNLHCFVRLVIRRLGGAFICSSSFLCYFNSSFNYLICGFRFVRQFVSVGSFFSMCDFTVCYLLTFLTIFAIEVSSGAGLFLPGFVSRSCSAMDRIGTGALPGPLSGPGVWVSPSPLFFPPFIFCFYSTVPRTAEEYVVRP